MGFAHFEFRRGETIRMPAASGGAPMKSKPADSMATLMSMSGGVRLLGDAVHYLNAFDRRGADARVIRPLLDRALPVEARGSTL